MYALSKSILAMVLAKDEESDTGQEYLRTSHVNIQNYHFYLNAAPVIAANDDIAIKSHC